MHITLDDIKWAAEECERQNSGELSVAHLCEALDFVRDPMWRNNIDDIETLGRMVEPEKNKRGFRQVPVHFFDLSTALPAHHIRSALTSLIENGQSATPTEWYIEFERIHPFIDGNGRVGAILFNLRNGTIGEPITPPKVVFGRDL